MAASPSSTSVARRLHHEHRARCPAVLNRLAARANEPRAQLATVVAAPAVHVIVGADAAGVQGAGGELTELDRRAIDVIPRRHTQYLLDRRRAVRRSTVADLAVVVVAPAPRFVVRVECAGVPWPDRHSVQGRASTNRHRCGAENPGPVSKLTVDVDAEAL